MASVYSDAYWTGTYTYTRVRVDYSGTSATAHLLHSRVNNWTGSEYAYGSTFSFGGASTRFDANTGGLGQHYDHEVASVAFSISTGGGYYSGSATSAGNYSFSGGVTIPAQATAPTGLNVSDIQRNKNGFTANVSITGWGQGSGTRYRELQVWTNSSSGLVEPRRYQPQYGNDLSGIITCDNSSSGSLNIQPNTMYVIGAYASNGAASTGSQRFSQCTTLAEAPTLSVNTAYETSVKLNYSTVADGGKYTKNIQYSINNGSTWTTGATVSSSSASSGTFSINGLEPGTSYTVKVRVSTDAGITNGSDINVTTLEAYKIYGSVSNKTKKVKKLYCSVSGKTKKIKKLYGSVGGKTKRIF